MTLLIHVSLLIGLFSCLMSLYYIGKMLESHAQFNQDILTIIDHIIGELHGTGIPSMAKDTKVAE